MVKVKKNTKEEVEWARAKRLCRLSREDVRMAKELGFRPRSLIGNIPNKSQKWKAPVHIWIRDQYEFKMWKSKKNRADVLPDYPPPEREHEPGPDSELEGLFEAPEWPDLR